MVAIVTCVNPHDVPLQVSSIVKAVSSASANAAADMRSQAEATVLTMSTLLSELNVRMSQATTTYAAAFADLSAEAIATAFLEFEESTEARAEILAQEHSEQISQLETRLDVQEAAHKEALSNLQAQMVVLAENVVASFAEASVHTESIVEAARVSSQTNEASFKTAHDKADIHTLALADIQQFLHKLGPSIHVALHPDVYDQDPQVDPQASFQSSRQLLAEISEMMGSVQSGVAEFGLGPGLQPLEMQASSAPTAVAPATAGAAAGAVGATAAAAGVGGASTHLVVSRGADAHPASATSVVAILQAIAATCSSAEAHGKANGTILESLVKATHSHAVSVEAALAQVVENSNTDSKTEEARVVAVDLNLSGIAAALVEVDMKMTAAGAAFALSDATHSSAQSEIQGTLEKLMTQVSDSATLAAAAGSRAADQVPNLLIGTGIDAGIQSRADITAAIAMLARNVSAALTEARIATAANAASHTTALVKLHHLVTRHSQHTTAAFALAKDREERSTEVTCNSFYYAEKTANAFAAQQGKVGVDTKALIKSLAKVMSGIIGKLDPASLSDPIPEGSLTDPLFKATQANRTAQDIYEIRVILAEVGFVVEFFGYASHGRNLSQT